MANTFDKNRFRRLQILDNLLKDPKGHTRKELEEKMSEVLGEPVNRHMIMRDLEVLEDELGCGIKKADFVQTDTKNQQERHIEKLSYASPATSPFSVSLSDDQIEYLSIALQMLGVKGIENMTVFRNLKLKVNTKNTFISYTTNPKDKIVMRVFETICRAIKDRRRISIYIRDRIEKGKKILHTVEPWHLREYNRRWYLFGYDCDNKRMMHYCLDRIVGKILEDDKKSAISRPEKIEDILKDVIGISIPESDPIDVIFWVSPKSADFVSNKPMHKSQQEIASDDPILGRFTELKKKGGTFFRLRCKNNYELRREMCSFGPELIVLAPDDLRQEVCESLKTMLSNYDSLPEE